jgi:hypothetical protein
MRQRTRSFLHASALRSAAATAAAVLALTLRAAPASAGAETVVGPSHASAVIELQAVRADGAVVSGTLVNRSSHPVRNVQLLIRYAWLWKNERSPGKNNPGRSDFYTVVGEIAPGGSLPFTYRPAKPLPRRSDGTFDTSAQVVAFTEVGE